MKSTSVLQGYGVGISSGKSSSTAFIWWEKDGTASDVMICVRLDPDGVATVRFTA